MLTEPYVTVASFKAYPTFLELDNIVSGNSNASDQDAQLNEMLLTASQWADDYSQMGAPDGTLSAHLRTENERVRLARDGRISYHADHGPVTDLVALSIGPTPNQLRAVTDLSNLWIEGDAQFVGFPSGGVAPGMATLQFGGPAVNADVYTQWTYVSGFVSTRLAAAVLAGATSLTVTDPTGLAAGVVLRIWQPGLQEAVTIAPSYVGGSTTVPLVAALKHAHDPTATPIEVSNMPSTIREAVIFYTASMLIRPSTGEEPFANSSTTLSITNRDGKRIDGPGMVAEAKRLLGEYGRVR